MARKNTRNRNIVVAIVILAVVFAGYTMLGEYTGEGTETHNPVDINTVANIVYTYRNGISLTPMSEGFQVITSQFDTLFQDTQIVVTISFLGSVVPSDVFFGVLRSGFFEVESKAAFSEGDSSRWYIIFDLGNCLMGDHSYVIDFRGLYELGDIPITGSSYSFRIDNQFESQVDPPVISSEPQDFQLVAGTEKTLSWTIIYLQDFTVYLKSDGILLDSQAFSGSSSPQTYTYVFSSDFEGQKDIVLFVDSVEVSQLTGYISGGIPEPDFMQYIIPAAIGIVILVVIISVMRRRR